MDIDSILANVPETQYQDWSSYRQNRRDEIRARAAARRSRVEVRDAELLRFAEASGIDRPAYGGRFFTEDETLAAAYQTMDMVVDYVPRPVSQRRVVAENKSKRQAIESVDIDLSIRHDIETAAIAEGYNIPGMNIPNTFIEEIDES